MKAFWYRNCCAQGFFSKVSILESKYAVVAFGDVTASLILELGKVQTAVIGLEVDFPSVSRNTAMCMMYSLVTESMYMACSSGIW